MAPLKKHGLVSAGMGWRLALRQLTLAVPVALAITGCGARDATGWAAPKKAAAEEAAPGPHVVMVTVTPVPATPLLAQPSPRPSTLAPAQTAVPITLADASSYSSWINRWAGRLTAYSEALTGLAGQVRQLSTEPGSFANPGWRAPTKRQLAALRQAGRAFQQQRLEEGPIDLRDADAMVADLGDALILACDDFERGIDTQDLSLALKGMTAIGTLGNRVSQIRMETDRVMAARGFPKP